MRKKNNNIFVSFLEVLHVKHTKRYSNKFYGEHPYKYNLYGLSTMLSDYNIENKAVRIIDKEQTVFELETPLIAHIGTEFLIVIKITQEKVSYLWNGKKITLPVEKFIAAWTGIILLAEPGENSIEPNYTKNRKEQLYWTPAFIIGDVSQQSIEEVWNSPWALKLANLTQDDFRDKSVCKSCALFDECISYNNRCVLDIVKAYGIENIDYPDPRCAQAPKFINELQPK
jgi:hypothetical protein